MSRIVIFEAETIEGLENQINFFGKTFEITSVSMTTLSVRGDWNYYACVVYKAGEQNG